MMLEERDAYIAIGLAIALTVALATGWYWLAIGAFSLPVLYVAVRCADDWLYDHFEFWD
jgi:hypothetical protein